MRNATATEHHVRMWAQRRTWRIAVVSIILVTISSRAADRPAAAILRDLRAFNEMGTVLHVAAHPDDENTQLITYLALGRHYRTGYLSLTRGDGGQNLIGSEFGEQLGVVRTQELLAARRLDGGRQFFTRAVDFGYSKDVRQTLEYWNREQVVGDIVCVIRTFQPDVLVTRFSTVPGTTHGHHTASAVLALEAFKLAGDPKAYPEQLKTLTVWQPKRIFMNGGGNAGGENAGVVRIDISGTDEVSGDAFSVIAGRSRGMHKSQGMGNFAALAGRAGTGPRMESFQVLAGEPASKDIMDGVDTTWGRITNGAEIGRLASEVIAKFNVKEPADSVPALLEIHARLGALPAEPIVMEKCWQLDRIIQACLGLSVETLADKAQVVPGETVKLRHIATVRSTVPVRWTGVRYSANGGKITDALDLRPNQAAERSSAQQLPPETPITQPYWLREEHEPGMFTVKDESLIGLPEAPAAFPIQHVFEVGGRTIIVADEPVHGEKRERLEIIPPVSIGLSSQVRLFAPASAADVDAELTALRPAEGKVELDVPAGWKVSPASLPFRFDAAGAHAKFTFAVTAPAQPAVAVVVCRVEIGGIKYSNRRIEIRHDSIPPQLLQPTARIKTVCTDVAIRGKQVGYLLGAGDNVADALRQMGFTVTMLDGADLTLDRLKKFDAIVIGVRAFNTRTDLAEHLADLLSYVEAGGNVIDQYNTPNELKSKRLGPYDITLSGNLPRNRVADPKAAITLLVPDHPAFNTPNRITPVDFDGWVQERGLNFPSEWDKEHWVSLLACNDAGEAPLKSGLLVAHYGKGYYVYTGLSFFRQLPAGVPGAYRLFANLASLGK